LRQMPHLRHDRLLNLGGRHAAHSTVGMAEADRVGREVVAVELASLARVACCLRGIVRRQPAATASAAALSPRSPPHAPFIPRRSSVPLGQALAGLSHDCPGDVGHRHFGTAR
jgi:hypothetical protein